MSVSIPLIQRKWSLLAILAVEGFLLFLFPPSLIFSTTIITGGDTGSHFPTAVALRHQLLTGGSLFTWMHGNYAGFPLFLNYFPFPFFLAALISLALPISIAFKLTTLLAIFLIPLALYGCLKNLGCRSPVPALGSVFSLLFLMMSENSMWGGNIASTLAGEFTYGISLAVSIHLAGRLYADIPRNRRLFSNAVLEAITALSNGYPLLQAGFGSTFFFWKRSFIPYTLLLHATAFGMIGFWILPLIWRLPWSTPFTHSWNIAGWREVLPVILFPAVAGIFAGWAARWVPWRSAVSDHSRQSDNNDADAPSPPDPSLSDATVLRVPHGSPEQYLWWHTGVSLLGFATAPILGLVDIRFLPFAQLYLVMLGAIGWGEFLQRFRCRDLLACLLAVSVFVCSAFNMEPAASWIRWNYSGVENKPLWPAFQAVNLRLTGDANDPRVFYEHAEQNNGAGSVRAFETIPYFSGRSTLEGLYMQSSITSPFVFYIQAELSRAPSCPFHSYYYAGFNAGRAAQHLRLFNVNRVVAVTEQTALSLDRSDAYSPDFQSPPFRVYRLNGVNPSYVVPLLYAPVRIPYRDWRNAQSQWLRKSSLDVPLLVTPEHPDGDYWRNLPPWDGKPETIPGQPLFDPSVDAIQASAILGEDTITVHTSRVMHPLWLKISYHPDWKVSSGTCEVYLTSPSFMLLVPHTSTVVLTFDTRHGIYAVGMGLSASTFLCIVGATFLRRRRMHGRRAPLHPPPSCAPPSNHGEAMSGAATIPPSLPAPNHPVIAKTEERNTIGRPPCGLLHPGGVTDGMKATYPVLRPWVWVLFALVFALALAGRSDRDPILLYTRAVNVYDKAMAIERVAPGSASPSGTSEDKARELNREAEKLFTRCMEKYPHSPVVDYCVHYLTAILQKDGRWKESQAILLSFLSIYPDTRSRAEFLYHLGLCARHLFNGGVSDDYFWQVLAFFPEDPWARHAAFRLIESTPPGDLLRVAKAYYTGQDMDRSRPLLEALSENGPQSLRAESSMLYACSFYYQSNWKEASRLLTDWLQQYPNHSQASEAWFTLSETQAYMQDYNAASASLQEALKRDPSLVREQPSSAFVETLDSLTGHSSESLPWQP